ncbi:MAG: hypothetical protein V4604_00580 [Bacteroidota bacterium]
MKRVTKHYLSSLIIILVITGQSSANAQPDSLDYYSKLFKDTTQICGGGRERAYEYITHHRKINMKKSNWIEKYLGVEIVEEVNGYKRYLYGFHCVCFESGAVHWPSCDYIMLSTKKRKLFFVDIENFG